MSTARTEPTRVAVFTAGYPPAVQFGGPIRTLAALIDEQPEGFDSVIITSDRDLGEAERLGVASNRWIDGEDGRNRYYVSTDSVRLMIRALRSAHRFRPDVLYLNSLFNSHFSIVPRLAQAVRWFRATTLVVAPRGELSPGALAIRSRKKRLFLRVFRLLRLHRGIVWHASSDDEEQEIRQVFGAGAWILVREDETHLPLSAQEPEVESTARLQVTFVSRITEKKGLHTLLKALLHVHHPVSLQVFGFAEDSSYVERCRHLARMLPDHVECAFGGSVDPDDVRDTFARFDLFAFPTAGENFGHVIAESLSVSCPVMCADTTPWSRLLDTDEGGVLVRSLDPLEWAAALDAYAVLTPADRMSRRRRAAAAYEQWRREDKGTHVFELARRIAHAD